MAMADVNKVILIGRLTRDAELKYTASGAAIGNFSIAVNRRKKNGEEWVEEVSFFDITLFGKAAESLNQYLLKGKQIALDGELRQDRWEQDGQNRSKVVIIANNVQLLGGNSTGSSGASGGFNQNSGKPQSASQNQFYQQKPQNANNFDAGQSFSQDDSFPEDIPF